MQRDFDACARTDFTDHATLALKILILNPSSLGDVVHALPVLRLIKKHFPASEVHWWLDQSLVPLLEDDPDLAGVIPFERQRWASPLRWHEALASVRDIRGRGFDWVIDLQSLLRSGAVAWMANASLTVGLDDPREGARGFYDLIARRPSYHTHAVDWYLGVLPLLGVPVNRDFVWLPERPAVAAAVREKWPDGGVRWIVLQPGARWDNKCWPVEHFAELAQKFSGHEFRFAILGGLADRPFGERIVRAVPERCLDLTGRTSLLQMVEWIRRSDLMVTNDTGPMHVAAALGKPVLALFGPTEPRRTGPYGQIKNVLRLDLPCGPCMKSHCRYEKPMECLRGLSAELVFSRAHAILSRADPLNKA